MKNLLIFLLVPFLSFGQTQIGDDIDGEAAGDRSGGNSDGISLSNNGNIVAIGAPNNDGNGSNSGHVRIYENVEGIWTQIGNDIDGEDGGDNFGASISLSGNGDIIAIGAPNNDGTTNGSGVGHLRIYENVEGIWTQIGSDIDGELLFETSGYSVSLSNNGSIVAVSSPDDTGRRVRVFENTGGIWTQIGDDIIEDIEGNYVGIEISLSNDGNIIALGASVTDGNGIYFGYVRVYKNTGGVWTQIGSDIDGDIDDGFSGFNVNLSNSGNIIAIGAPFNENDFSRVRVYENIGDVWIQIGDDINGEVIGDNLGSSVSLSNNGDIIAIGIPNSNGENGIGSGKTCIYKNLEGFWIQIGDDINGESLGDQSGINISLSNDGAIVAIAAIYNDGNGVDSGHVRVYDLSQILSLNEQII